MKLGGKMLKRVIYIFVFTVLYSFAATADTTDQTWMTKVELTKTGMHCADDRNCFNRYHPNIPMAAEASCDYRWVSHHLLSRYQGSRPIGFRLIDQS